LWNKNGNNSKSTIFSFGTLIVIEVELSVAEKDESTEYQYAHFLKSNSSEDIFTHSSVLSGKIKITKIKGI